MTVAIPGLIVPIPALIVFAAAALLFVALGLVGVFNPRRIIRFSFQYFPTMNVSAESENEGCAILQVRIMGVVFICGGLFLLLSVASALSSSR